MAGFIMIRIYAGALAQMDFIWAKAQVNSLLLSLV